MSKTKRAKSSGTKASADIRTLLTVPHSNLESRLAARLDRSAFPALRPGHIRVLGAIERLTSMDADDGQRGVRIQEVVGALSMPKQTVGCLLDELEVSKMIERLADPDHGGIRRVRLGAKGMAWAAEVNRSLAATEADWTTRLGSKKMKSLRTLLEELAVTVQNLSTATHDRRSLRTRRS